MSSKLSDLERRPVLVAVEGDPVLAPQPRQQVELDPLLREAVLVVKDLVLVEVALDQDADLLAGEAHAFDPRDRWRQPLAASALSQSDSRSAIIRIPAWQLPDGTAGMTLASATRSPVDARGRAARDRPRPGRRSPSCTSPPGGGTSRRSPAGTPAAPRRCADVRPGMSSSPVQRRECLGGEDLAGRS